MTKACFLRIAKKAVNSLEESAESLGWNRSGFWNEFTEEIWADSIAITLAGVPYLTALTMQILGQGSGQFFYSDPSISLQEWAKQPIYDLESPEQDRYFWQARLKLVIDSLENIHEESCKKEMNKQWLEAIKKGINWYQHGGKLVFTTKRTTQRHEQLWEYREELNDWVYKTIVKYQGDSRNIVKKYKFLSTKYSISSEFMTKVITPVVKNFDKRFFTNSGQCEYGKDYDASDKSMLRIEYLPFHIKWYLSKRIIMELALKEQDIRTFTFAYANYIRNDGSAAFRLALEWILARNELNIAYADYLEEDQGKIIKPLFDERFDRNNTYSCKLDKIKIELKKIGKLQDFITQIRYQKFYNSDFEKKIAVEYDFYNELMNLTDSFMGQRVNKLLVEMHTQDDGASIGMFTFGSLTKQQSKTLKNASKEVYDYYQEALNSLNNPKLFGEKIEMPKRYGKSGEEKFSYGNQINEERGNTPQKNGLYFVTGHFDFIHFQKGITAGECTARQTKKLTALTNTRTVLDLCVNDKANRDVWGKVSIIKFRYRWEVYWLAEQLKTKNFRFRLMLSSGWEDAIFVTWHDAPDKFWEEGFLKLKTMDSITCVLLFKVDKSGQVIDLQSVTGMCICDKSEQYPFEMDLGSFIKTNNDFTNHFKTLGRFDYIYEWCASTPRELVEKMILLPEEFWGSVTHINTTLRLRMDSGKPVFFSEITTNSFPEIKN
ncbi:hypothetical protein VZ94_06860 [Methylocucumis oryzae]|uniref:Uncharacterized protein n=2 Tax=Methylocucumis oryzae TaxID=1632867 RepID=A0A0F3IK76_9GAMM|nr:hypothetical protein VZ94_06860 [Methylocucumis oryzae]